MKNNLLNICFVLVDLLLLYIIKRYKKMKLTDYLEKIDACESSIEFCQGKTFKEAFYACERGDWLLWMFKKTMPSNEDNLRLLTRAKAHCALTVRHLMKDERSIKACEVALRFADGLITRKELAAYADAAYAAATAADAAYADAAARTKNRKETANICRKYLPFEIWPDELKNI